MTVAELIAALQKLPPNLDVCVWDEEEGDYVLVGGDLWGDGHTRVDLATYPNEGV